MSEGISTLKSRRIFLNILVFAFLFTLVSGFYIEIPLILDAEIIRLGFPLHWLTAGRSTLWGIKTWQFFFLWYWFIVDLAIYGLLIAIAVVIYEKKLKDVSKLNIYRVIFRSSSLVLLICFYILVFQVLYYRQARFDFLDIAYWRFLLYHIAEYNLLFYLIGETTVIFTWSFIKYRKQPKQ